MTTTNTNTDIIATGGFNTGRKYTAAGQRIFWAQRADGWLYFKDADRMIDGWMTRDLWGAAADTIPAAELARPVSPQWLMNRYDNHKYTYQPYGDTAERNPQAPADLDYGSALRI
jgi:hypothetical protein